MKSKVNKKIVKELDHNAFKSPGFILYFQQLANVIADSLLVNFSERNHRKLGFPKASEKILMTFRLDGQLEYNNLTNEHAQSMLMSAWLGEGDSFFTQPVNMVFD